MDLRSPEWPFGDWLAQIQSPLWISVKVSITACCATFALAILIAWKLRSRKGLFAALLDSACALPLVLPPTVIGYFLIQLVGRRGLLGPALADAGINLMFSWQGAVLAASIVIFPLIYKSAKAALEQVNGDLEDAARTLGASELRIFLTLSIPLAWKGILAGLILAFARGMGEFGATLMIAGNIPGKTQTLALAIYSAFQAGEDTRAFFLALATSVFCCFALVCAECFGRTGRN